MYSSMIGYYIWSMYREFVQSTEYLICGTVQSFDLSCVPYDLPVATCTIRLRESLGQMQVPAAGSTGGWVMADIESRH